jgi:hypothetical protein
VLLEPRKAGPRALRRWSLQALQLMVRGIGFWLGMVLLLCLAIFAGQRLPLVGGVLALAGFFGSIIVAAALDRADRTTAAEVLAALAQHARAIAAFGGVIACTGALVWILLLARPGVAWWNVLYTERNIVTVLSPDWFTALRQIFVYSAYALGLGYFGLNIPGLTSFFQFPCATLLGMPFRDAYRLGTQGQMTNLLPMLGVGLLFISLPVVAVLLFPPAVPLLYCFLGALAYVSFREVFLGRPDNRVRARAVAMVPGSVPT